ncbi:DgyrCDS10023 [Dimorphilus gyrociliatus]|uniref:DgyrCDS10023 n=1 Tax=Dimorphilus gyrociliatus TaxID=2664684 RepID=A0A7I8W0E1_9ANNE|nr:DgyrCDS10023 [Dimorphilus gyrociliatus]
MATTGGANMSEKKMSLRDLWHCLANPDKVSQEHLRDLLKANNNDLLNGLLKYSNESPNSINDSLKKLNVTTSKEIDYYKKLNKFLTLNVTVCHKLHKDFVKYDLRNGDENEDDLLRDERNVKMLLYGIRDFYYTERLLLLQCIKHLLHISMWPDQKASQKIQSLFDDTVKQMCNNNLAEKLLEQYKFISGSSPPNLEENGSYMTDQEINLWQLQKFRELESLLEILLLFYKSMELTPAYSLKYLKHFKETLDWMRKFSNGYFSDYTEKIRLLQVCIIIEGFDLEYLKSCKDTNDTTKHSYITCSQFQEIENEIKILGCDTGGSPLMLSWGLVKYCKSNNEADIEMFGEAAISMNMFKYLSQMLSLKELCHKTKVNSIVKTTYYGMMQLLLDLFDASVLSEDEEVYNLIANILSEPTLSSMFWDQGLDNGLGLILKRAATKFPSNFLPFMELSIALAKSSSFSAQNIFEYIKRLDILSIKCPSNALFDLKSNDFGLIATLQKDYYPLVDFCVAKNTKGILYTDKETVEWYHKYNGFHLFSSMLKQLLNGNNDGNALVHLKNLSKIYELVSSISNSDSNALPYLQPIIQSCFPLQEDCLQFGVDGLSLASACFDNFIDAETILKAWTELTKCNFLPLPHRLNQTISDIVAESSGKLCTLTEIVHAECGLLEYRVVKSCLNYVIKLIPHLADHNRLDELISLVVFILNNIFTVYVGWSYSENSEKETIGIYCLQIFHKILNIFSDPTEERQQICEVLLYCLLHSKAGFILLELIGTGSSTINAALVQQGSITDGQGTKLVEVVTRACSLLNILLLLRPNNGEVSPIETTLCSKTSTRWRHKHEEHVVRVIAEYVLIEYDQRLPRLAVMLLKKLARVLNISILSCFEPSANFIRDVYFDRLKSRDQPLAIKVAILEFLSACTESQPGLIELFMNITHPVTQAKASANKDSCLDITLKMIDENIQRTEACPSDLLCAAMQFIHSLWASRKDAAMNYLCSKPNFWKCVCSLLLQNLSEIELKTELRTKSFSVRASSFIFSILAEELYGVEKDDEKLKEVLNVLVSESRFEHWSEFLTQSLCEIDIEKIHKESSYEANVFQLLLGWKKFVYVISGNRPDVLRLEGKVREKIVIHLLTLLEKLLDNGSSENKSYNKIASVTSSIILVLLRHWSDCLEKWKFIMTKMKTLLSSSLHFRPSVQIGTVTSTLICLQELLRRGGIESLEEKSLLNILEILCRYIKEISHLNIESSNEVKVQVSVLYAINDGVSLMKSEFPDNFLWFSNMKKYSVFEIIISSLSYVIQNRCAYDYVSASLLFLLNLTMSSEVALCISSAGFTQHLCLKTKYLYSKENGEFEWSEAISNENSILTRKSGSWSSLFINILKIVRNLLETRRLFFVDDAFNFAGVHDDRILATMQRFREQCSIACLPEIEASSAFISQLSFHSVDWRTQLPNVMNKLMKEIMHLSEFCVALVVKPKFLQTCINKQMENDPNTKIKETKKAMRRAFRRISSISASSDDCDAPSRELAVTQYKLYKIIAHCLLALRNFSPNLQDGIFDQVIDLSDYEPLLLLVFSTPSLDEMSATPSFGTLITITNACLRLFSKLEPRQSSPAKSPVSYQDFAPLTK